MSARGTAHSLPARLAVESCVHEARGLDVLPQTIARFRAGGDAVTADLLLSTVYPVRGSCAPLCALRHGMRPSLPACSPDSGSGSMLTPHLLLANVSLVACLKIHFKISRFKQHAHQHARESPSGARKPVVSANANNFRFSISSGLRSHACRRRFPTARQAPSGSTGSSTTGIITQRQANHLAERHRLLQPRLWARLLLLLLLLLRQRFSQDGLHLPRNWRLSHLCSPSRTQTSRAPRLRT